MAVTHFWYGSIGLRRHDGCRWHYVDLQTSTLCGSQDIYTSVNLYRSVMIVVTRYVYYITQYHNCCHAIDSNSYIYVLDADENNNPDQQGPYRGCCWHSDASSQTISSHDIEYVGKVVYFVYIIYIYIRFHPADMTAIVYSTIIHYITQRAYGVIAIKKTHLHWLTDPQIVDLFVIVEFGLPCKWNLMSRGTVSVTFICNMWA